MPPGKWLGANIGWLIALAAMLGLFTWVTLRALAKSRAERALESNHG